MNSEVDSQATSRRQIEATPVAPQAGSDERFPCAPANSTEISTTLTPHLPTAVCRQRDPYVLNGVRTDVPTGVVCSEGHVYDFQTGELIELGEQT